MKYSTESICLDDVSTPSMSRKILCEEKNEGLFITEVEYTNDYTNICADTNGQQQQQQQHGEISEFQLKSL